MRLTEQQKLVLFTILYDSLKNSDDIFLISYESRKDLLEEIINNQQEKEIQEDEIDPAFAPFVIN